MSRPFPFQLSSPADSNQGGYGSLSAPLLSQSSWLIRCKLFTSLHRCFLNAKGVYNYADERDIYREGQGIAPGSVEEDRQRGSLCAICALERSVRVTGVAETDYSVGC